MNLKNFFSGKEAKNKKKKKSYAFLSNILWTYTNIRKLYLWNFLFKVVTRELIVCVDSVMDCILLQFLTSPSSRILKGKNELQFNCKDSKKTQTRHEESFIILILRWYCHSFKSQKFSSSTSGSTFLQGSSDSNKIKHP